MANTLFSIRLPKQLEKECIQLSQNLGFSTVQEFMREALRDKIDESKRKLALYAIANLPKQKAQKISQDELNELAKNV